MPLTEPVTLQSLLFASTCTLGFIGVLFVLAIVLPGRRVEGFAQPNGDTKTYTINGMGMWLLAHLTVIGDSAWFELSLSPLVRHFWSFFVVANATAVVWTAVLFFVGRTRRAPEDHVGGLRGVYQDWWYGAELNPTWLGVDLKVFAYQPSLIGLVLFNLAFGYAQYETLGTLTPQMLAYQAFWWLYMTTHYIYEAGVLSMWDVIAERFGFMLVWGDLVLVPFFYCIAGWTLVTQSEPMPAAALAGVSVLHVLGLWIFRGSNAQKNRFKRDRTVKIWGRPARTVGGRLLVSGFWGIGRKLNYTGEICVYSSYALCTGAQSIVPYLLPLWLVSLLVHRAWRDEKRCSQKYGDVWQEYTARARFRMIPFVY